MYHRAHLAGCYLVILCLLFGSSTGYSQGLFEQKIHFNNDHEQASDTKKRLAQITPDTVWLLTGINTSNKARLIIIEIGKHKASYRNRINQERGILPGPFTIRLYPYGYKTSKGTPLLFEADTRVKVFSLEQDQAITNFKLTPYQAQKLDALYAFDLGPEGHTVWQGFESMTPSHPLLIHTRKVRKKKLNPFTRLSLDPLIRDGISGLISLKLPLPSGQWRLHIWTEDVGYWQTLPEQIERRIRINGKDREYQLNRPWQWVQNRYTQNKFRLSQFEKLDNITSWRAIGQYRGGHKSFDVEAENGELTIELAGANKMASSITALIIEKSTQRLLSDVNFERALWFNSRWPLLPQPKTTIPSKTLTKNTPYNLTRNNPLFIKLAIDKKLTLNNLGWQNNPFIIEKRLSLAQLERSLDNYKANPAGSFLAIRPLLISAEKPDDQHSGELHLMIKAPSNLTAGTHSIQLINNQDQTLLQQIDIQLLDIELPNINKPIGIYLDLAPHLFLSFERKNMADKQLMCDLTTLSSLSLTGVAPPFPLPKNKTLQADYHSRLKHLLSLGFQPPFLDYAGLKNLRYQYGQDQTVQRLKQLTITTDKQPRSLAISIADEPSNASSKGFSLKTMASLVDKSQVFEHPDQVPSLLKAAHLNHPKDSQWLDELDIALINHGYGVNRQRIQHIRNHDVDVWLYNMSNKRLAAGFFLWKHKLSGYLQWHARMPTADPYDPTDGREDDQQLLPVMAKLCAKKADLHPELIAIAEGVTDHKWLKWLDQMSQHSILAYQLRQKLLQKIPNAWQSAENISSVQLQTWRNDIEELALSISKRD